MHAEGLAPGVLPDSEAVLYFQESIQDKKQSRFFKTDSQYAEKVYRGGVAVMPVGDGCRIVMLEDGFGRD